MGRTANYSMPSNIDLTHYRGDTFKGALYTISLSGGLPLDLTGANIKYQIRKDGTDEDSVFEFTDITIIEPLSGSFSVNPVVINIPARTYYYDIQIIDNTGFVRTPVAGSFVITQDVSR